MRHLLAFPTIAALVFPLPASAQCFNRPGCGDGSGLQVQSQISLNVPVADGASQADQVKAIEDARRDLYALANRECDTLKNIFGGECSLASVNVNSSLQDRSNRGRMASVSLSSQYEVKRPAK